MDNILKSVTERIQPGKTTEKNVERTVKKINRALEKNDVKAECMIGGSFAKDTHLRGDHDVDLFVRFDRREYHDEDISKILGDILPFEAEKIPGSRDYYQATRYGNLDFEIIPVLEVERAEEAKNVTDMSPLHVKYVKKAEKKNKNLSDEIRLSKQFCKANRVYGAESYIQGFSGHVVDLLTIYYGSFKKLVNAAADWDNRVVIDMESHWSNPLKQLNKSKIQSPLVLVDPIQPDRNAAAALSREKFELFKNRCREFLEEPSEDFFSITKLDVDDLERKAESDSLVVLKAWPYKAKEDVMGAKLRQVYEYMFRKLEEDEWPIVESDWEFRKGEGGRKLEDQPKGFFYFIVDDDVPNYIEREGPPVTEGGHVKEFTRKHDNTFVRDGRLYTRIDRRFNTPRERLEDVAGHKYVSERAKKVEFVEVEDE